MRSRAGPGKLRDRRRWWRVGKGNSMHRFPIVGRDHLDRVPRTAIKKGAVRTFANAFLAADAEIGINFDPAERWMVLVRDPEHAGIDRTVFNARRRSCTAGATVSGDGQDARLLLASGLTIANRHWPMFFYNVEHTRIFTRPILQSGRALSHPVARLNSASRWPRL